MQIAQALSKGWEEIRGGRDLPGYALHYYDALKAQFITLSSPPPEDVQATKAYADAATVVGKPRSELGWTDLMLLDLSTLRILSPDCLRFKVADLRHRLDGMAMPLPAELSVKLDSVNPGQMNVLRCEAEMLVTHLWHKRIAQHSRDQYVGELRRTMFGWMLLIIVLLVIVPSLLSFAVPLWFIIITTGMLGALTSILRRLKAVTESKSLNLDQNNDLSALANEKRAGLISLFAGGVFAILLYVSFVAGLSDLSGKLAPGFSNPDNYPKEGVNFLIFVLKIGPATGADYAKVVVWSFAAGFFEQLVPNVLDRIMKKDVKPD